MVFGQDVPRRCQLFEEVFQFPVGIRWCSDGHPEVYEDIAILFQFPVGIRWCSDPRLGAVVVMSHSPFQFPVGIRWCSDFRVF